MEDSRARWQRVYAERGPEEVSWYETVPETSLELIQEAALPLDAAILDIGGAPRSWRVVSSPPAIPM
jgi:hypothetical protein